MRRSYTCEMYNVLNVKAIVNSPSQYLNCAFSRALVSAALRLKLQYERVRKALAFKQKCARALSVRIYSTLSLPWFP